MNERIKELMDYAVRFRLDPDSNAYEAQVQPEDLERFAELIIRECAGLVQGVPTDSMGYHTADQKIKEHFGVKE